jgi:hypothetical protein
MIHESTKKYTTESAGERGREEFTSGTSADQGRKGFIAWDEKNANRDWSLFRLPDP